MAHLQASAQLLQVSGRLQCSSMDILKVDEAICWTISAGRREEWSILN